MLKRLELQGFKSFADRTALDLDAGITAIVGPNGAGKSNIADAVRWSLGEQRARELRGERMDDFIFNGSRSRRMMGMARSRLTLDNDDGRYALPYATITLGREVNREGRGRYLINGQQVRLRDIEEILYGTGLGPSGYAIIGQGEVDRIIESDEDELRALIEEAAGTSAERAWLQRSHRPREQVRAAVERLRDREALMAARLEPLIDDVRRLRLHRQSSAVLAALQAELHQRELKRILQQQQEAKRGIARHARHVSRLLEARSALSGRRHQLERRLADLSTRFQECRAALDEAEQAAQAGARRMVRARAEQEDVHRAERQLAHERRALEAERQELTSLPPRAVEEMEEQREAAASRLDRLTPRLEAWDRAAATCETRLNAWRRRAAELQEEARRVEQRLRARARRQQEARRRESERQRSLRRIEAGMASIQRQGEAVAGHRRQVQQLQQLLVRMGEAGKAVHEKLAEERRACLARGDQLRSRIDTVDGLQRSYAGYYRGVRRVMRGKAAGEAPFQGCIGPLSDLLTVPPEYRRALTAALGSAQQHIVCGTAGDAEAAIKSLEREGAGRATFLPLDFISQRPSPGPLPQVEGAEILGWAPDLVKFDDELAAAVHHRLGRVLVVGDLADARRVAKATGRRFTVVTLSGAIIHPGGAMTGGRQGTSRQDEHSLLGRAQDLRRWRRQLARTEAKQAVLEEQWSLLENGAEQLGQSMKATARQEHRYSEVARRLQRLGRRLDRQLSVYQNQSQPEEREAEQAALRSLAVRFKELEREEADARRRMARFEELMAPVRSRREDLREHVSAARLELRELASRIEDARRRRRSAAERLEHIQEAIAELQARTRHLQQRRERAARELSEAQDDHRQAEAEVARLTPATAAARQRQARAAAQAEALQRAAAAVHDRLRRHRRGLQQAAAASQRLAIRQEERSRSAAGGGTGTAAGTSQRQPAVRLRLAGTSMTLLRRAIRRVEGLRSACEPVNGRAEDEYHGLMSHYGTTCRQLEDLVAAEDMIDTLQAQVEQRLSRRFHETFAVLNRAFGRLFARLFQGGEAELVPVAREGDVPGCRIEAQPPGKRRQALRLLSGGERSLTALALLFAFLAVRPSPFVVLDEVDAALDDPNLERFTRFVGEYAQHVQFILITHQKPTMEVADRLFGVTMADDGVSQVVSVRLQRLRAVGQENGGAAVSEREEAR